ncbi:ChrR family anti-sigma-E factor [Shewanella mesophila]|uniref:ChrR family anti-sigma-E factor n=1 Tax=Shewanella mesophila TaxID=2864208 RepID=UPI001C65888B|nr:ChrR family anti-sigma-E factor [Shewanella mesophila]QYJ84935.1 ChrR family anti-sigma-E factor [Shewanella mesophila]
MIKHHPTSSVLRHFVAGELPVSVAVIVASHVELCDECRAAVQLLTEQAAAQAFDDTVMGEALSGLQSDTPIEDDEFFKAFDFDAATVSDITGSDAANMIESITEQSALINSALAQTVNEIEISGTRIKLPRAIKSIALREWQGLGKLSRARLALEDQELRASLLHIDKGGSVPCHTHKGFEITLILRGSFEDEMGSYREGDFMWLDGDHTHQPVTKEGCVCLTVSSDAIHFTQGMSQLLNPIGRFIY